MVVVGLHFSSAWQLPSGDKICCCPAPFLDDITGKPSHTENFPYRYLHLRIWYERYHFFDTIVLNGDTSQNCSIFCNKLIEVGFSVSLRVSLILFAVEFFIGSIFIFYSLSQDLVRYVVFQLPLFMI